MIGKCDYCETDNIEVRATPFLADVPAKMCEYCWDITKKEYLNSESTYIGEFKQE